MDAAIADIHPVHDRIAYRALLWMTLPHITAMWLTQASQTTILTAGSRHGTAAALGRFPVFIPS